MKRKHSIFLGIGFIGGSIYLGYLLFILFGGMFAANQTQNYMAMFSLVFAGTLLLPHLIVILVGCILILIAWIRDSFGLSLSAAILYFIAIFLRFDYVFYILPIVISAIIGCVTSYQHKQQRLEEAEEQAYRQRHPQQQGQETRQNRDYAQRQMNQFQNQMGQPNGTVSNGYANTPYPQLAYAQNPYVIPQDPYAPLTNQQPQTGFMEMTPMSGNQTNASAYDANMNTMNGYGAEMNPYMSEPSNIYNGNVDMNYVDPYQQNQTMIAPPTLQPKINDGYFDDYGNFHMDGEGKYT